MSGKTALAITVLIASAAWGQTPSAQESDRVFRFAHLDTPPARQEMLNIVRSIAEIQRASVDNQAGALVVHGTAGQLDLADWLFHAVDQPPGVAPSPMLEHRADGFPHDPVARVFYITNTPTPQGMQEIVNAVRSVTEIQRVVAEFPTRAIVTRSSPDAAMAAEWVINLLDKPAGVQPGAGPNGPKLEHAFDDPRNPVLRVVYLAHSPNPQAAQELINTVRALTDLQRVVMCNSPKAIVVRGTADQSAMLDWIIGKLDIAQAPQSAPKVEFPMPKATDGVARLFYLTHTGSPQAIQELVNVIRTSTSMQRVVQYHTLNAVALRGTADQVAQAERLVQELDKSAAQ